jgi:hypothetical protein
MIEQDVEEYETGNSRGFRPWEGVVFRRKRSIWHPWWGVGGKDAESIFENAGLVVLTDAFLFSEPEPIGKFFFQLSLSFTPTFSFSFMQILSFVNFFLVFFFVYLFFSFACFHF